MHWNLTEPISNSSDAFTAHAARFEKRTRERRHNGCTCFLDLVDYDVFVEIVGLSDECCC
jgi:hypothetical protein